MRHVQETNEDWPGDNLYRLHGFDHVYGRKVFGGYSTAFHQWYRSEASAVNKLNPQRMVFITLTSGGLKEQHQPYAGYWITEELALDALIREIKEWVKDKEGNMHFRRPPEAHSQTVTGVLALMDI